MSDSPEPPAFIAGSREEEVAILAEIAAAHHVAPDALEALIDEVMVASLTLPGDVDRRLWLIFTMTYMSKESVLRSAGSPAAD